MNICHQQNFMNNTLINTVIQKWQQEQDAGDNKL